MFLPYHMLMKRTNIKDLSKTLEMLELGPVGHKISTNVKIYLAWSHKAHKLSSTCLGNVYDTFSGWVVLH